MMTLKLSNIAMIALFVALLGFLLPTSAIATKSKSVNFEQYTIELVPGLPQSLRGVDASVTCVDGRTISGPLFHFSASRTGPSNSGNWDLLAAPGAAAGDTGTTDKVRIAPKHFKLHGSWDDPTSRGFAVICSDGAIPTNFVIEGACGIGVTVMLKASNGVTGSFKGDVICN